MDSAKAVSQYKNTQNILRLFATLNLVAYQWPKPACVEDGAKFDFIIVGAGTAGCVIANRLIEAANVTVLLIEAGGDPPYEVETSGLFVFLKKSRFDWNFTSTCNNFAMRNGKNKIIEMTQGKMIGGSGSLNYLAYERGNRHDYEQWAHLTNDSSWSWESVFPIFLKNEKLIDKRILNSPDKCFYGTEGKIKMKKQYFKRNDNYFNAFKEMGYDNFLDINPKHPLGYTDVMFAIGDEERQSTALEFLSPIKDHPNLYVMTDTLATKIIFDNNKNAVGVEVLTKDNKIITVKAKKEVIVSAGTIKSPQLLMLSGIGPKHHLKAKGIKIVADLAVGKNFQDHVNGFLIYKLTKAEKATNLEDPHKYPFAVFDGLVALNKSQGYPDYQTIGVSIGDQLTFLGLCAFYFNLGNEVCDALQVKVANSELLLVVITFLYPKSRGEILLNSTDPTDNPIIIPGYYNEHKDVVDHANYLEDFNRVLNTTYFKSVNAELIDPNMDTCAGLYPGSKDYWQCYVLGMSDTSFYYVGTCPMGSVLDSRLRVKGVHKLRVADASIMPTTVGATTQATVIMIAQKAADMIIEDCLK